MSQQVYMPYFIIYIQRFLGITDYTLLLAGVLVISSAVSVLMGAAHRQARQAAGACCPPPVWVSRGWC